MSQKVEQWMRDAVDEMWNSNLLLQSELLKALSIIASHAPSPSPDICEKCGQEVIDGHWSLVCHKPACIKALQEEDADYLGEAAAQPQQWMKLPPNQSYPGYKGIHKRDDWCEKAGCIPVCKAAIEHNDH